MSARKDSASDRRRLGNLPDHVACPMAVLAGLLLAAVGSVGFRSRQLTVRGSLLGLLAFLSTVVAAAVLAIGLWMVMARASGGYRALGNGTPHNARPPLWA